MRIVCIGSGEMFRYCVQELLWNKEDVILAVFTWHDRHADRIARFAVLDKFMEDQGIPFFKVDSINETKNVKIIEHLAPDMIFVDGWSEKISNEILKIPPKGCVGIHPSLLPKYRGGATINWAIINGEKNWGLSLYYLAEKIDKGDIIGQKEFEIELRDTCKSVFDKVGSVAIDLLRQYIPLIREDRAPRVIQDETKATYTKRRSPEDGSIDWSKTSIEIYNLVRALTHPYPGAFFRHNGKKIIVWEAELCEGKLEPSSGAGTVIEVIKGRGIVVQTGEGKILLKRVQQENDFEKWADDFAENMLLKRNVRFDYASQ